MRIAIIAIVSALSLVSSAAVSAAPPIRTVDVGQPAALERLRSDDPTRYEAVASILQAYEHIECKARELETLRARYDAHETACHAVVLTSLPPKRHVAFVLGDTLYEANVVLKDAGVTFVPAVVR